MKPSDRDQLKKLIEETEVRRARRSLRVFVERTWPTVEPGSVFGPNWHIDLICEHLEAVSAGQIRRLVINVPPRHGKSLLVSVFWPCWEWEARPWIRDVFSSYSESLASYHSLARRRVIRSRTYQRFAPNVRLTKDQQEKLEFHNTQGGAMVATSTGGSITGKGGNRIIIDDPHNPSQAESDAQRQQAIDFYRHTLSTRLDDPQHGAIVLVMQRLHTRDLTAVCLEQGFEHLCLPALAPSRTTIVFPRSQKALVREPDTALWPERHGVAELERQRRALGSYGFAGQYQQEPVPREGGMFRPEWWGWFDAPPAQLEVYQSWDLAFKGGDGHDYVVGLVAVRVKALVYIVDRFKAKAAFTDTCRAIVSMGAKYPQTRAVLVEDAANGPAVLDVLRHQVRGILAVTPAGGKQSRAAAVQPQIEAGQVLLPRPRYSDGQIRRGYEWVEDFVDTCSAFPKGEHDDDVDALTQLLVYLQKRPSGLSVRQILGADDDDDDRVDGGGGSNRFGGWGNRLPDQF